MAKARIQKALNNGVFNNLPETRNRVIGEDSNRFLQQVRLA
jgi:hypothetical protein